MVNFIFDLLDQLKLTKIYLERQSYHKWLVSGLLIRFSTRGCKYFQFFGRSAIASGKEDLLTNGFVIQFFMTIFRQKAVHISPYVEVKSLLTTKITR